MKILNCILISTLSISIHAGGSSKIKVKKKHIGKFTKYANETYRKYDNSITLHMIRSPYGINWKKRPRSVLKGLVKNKYFFPDTKRTIGHVTVELNCKINGKKVNAIGAQGAVDLGMFTTMLVKDGVGMSLVNTPDTNPDLPLLTIPGKFETLSDLEPEFDRNIHKKKMMSFLTYLVTPEQCQKMLSFMNEYERITYETKGTENPRAANVYGFGADPLKFEGSGCAPFAEAFFKLINMEEEFAKFKQTIHVTPKLIGGAGTNNKVSLGRIWKSKENIQDYSEEKRTFSFADPDLMFEMVWNVVKKEKNLKKYTQLKSVDSGRFGDSKAYYLILK